MHIEILDTISQISAAAWNRISGTDYPFLRHEFLYALEASNSVCIQSGWQPQHLLVYNNTESNTESKGELIAVMPLYLKHDSYGEYVFDWSWANAYQRTGLPYYPKLVSAIPFTPTNGPRLAISDSADTQAVFSKIVASLKALAKTHHCSSIHILFPALPESRTWREAGFAQRTGVQYHWFNQNYESFEHFLDQFTSRKRKNLKKERYRVSEQEIALVTRSGDEINDQWWDIFYHFYQQTYAKRSGHGGYLRREFFHLIGELMPTQATLVFAQQQKTYVAGALYFASETTLFGRYWGCLQEFDMLHFETCYYQGIELCIARNLQSFNSGAQGEHKIQRGFMPIETYSNHWIADARFKSAIGDFLQREAQEIKSYILDAQKYLPFKKNS